MQKNTVWCGTNLHHILIRPVEPEEETRFKALLDEHHYLGSLPKIGETIWYVAILQDQWIALLSFSSAALKCAARDCWIGWNYRNQFDRLHLITNNSRFLILPEWHHPNVASRVLSLCRKRLAEDWQLKFSHPLLLVETFVDPTRFSGTIYKADNWTLAGETKGFRRSGREYIQQEQSRKLIFLHPLQQNAQAILSQPVLEQNYRHGRSKLMLLAEHMYALPQCFKSITDPRRGQGKRHSLSTVLSLVAAATLCGYEGYRQSHGWIRKLSQKTLERFGCYRKNGRYIAPSMSVIRDVIIRVDPEQLDKALQQWNESQALEDDTLAIDGKTMCNAIDDSGHQTHIMSAIGHDSKVCYTQKK